MTSLTRAAALLPALLLSSLLVACGGGEDTADQAALERRALQRDLGLAALTPDTTPEVTGEDGPPVDSLAGSAAPAAAAPAPATTPASAAPRQTAPRRPSERAPADTRPWQPARPATLTRTAPAGQTFTVRMDQAVSTRTMSVGETFTATLAHDLTDDQGRTVIPAGATVRGRVTRSQASGRAGSRSDIAVAFTSIVSGGETHPIDVTMVSAPAVERRNRHSRTRTAATVGGGAVAGGVLGRVIGKDTRSTVAGAVIGAAAGTAVAIGTAEVDAVIPAGSTATVRLDSPVRVTRGA